MDTGEWFVLENLPYNSIPPHVAVFVNDPKLSDIKQLLMQNGMSVRKSFYAVVFIILFVDFCV